MQSNIILDSWMPFPSINDHQNNLNLYSLSRWGTKQYEYEH